jgi:hypothetical protein
MVNKWLVRTLFFAITGLGRMLAFSDCRTCATETDYLAGVRGLELANVVLRHAGAPALPTGEKIPDAGAMH